MSYTSYKRNVKGSYVEKNTIRRHSFYDRKPPDRIENLKGSIVSKNTPVKQLEPEPQRKRFNSLDIKKSKKEF